MELAAAGLTDPDLGPPHRSRTRRLGLGGHANPNEELVLAARAQIADLKSQQ